MSSLPKTLFVVLVTSLTLISTIGYSQAEEAQQKISKEAIKETPNKARLPLEELRNFTQVFDQVRRSYVEEVDDEKLLEMSIIGLLNNLDPHSAYLDKNAFASGLHRLFKDLVRH